MRCAMQLTYRPQRTRGTGSYTLEVNVISLSWCANDLRGSIVSVNRWRYVPLMIVTIAESIVMLIRTHSPIFVDRFICSFQNAATGTTASTKSVNVVYAHSQYEK